MLASYCLPVCLPARVPALPDTLTSLLLRRRRAARWPALPRSRRAGKSKPEKLFNFHFRNRPSLGVLWICTRTSERPSDGRDGCCPAAYLALFIPVASSSPSLAADPGSQHSLARRFFSRLSSANEAILGFEDEREGLSLITRARMPAAIRARAVDCSKFTRLEQR